MVEKEIIATKYTLSALKKGVKKSQKCAKRQKFPHDLQVMILGVPSLFPDTFKRLESDIFVPREGTLIRTAK
jgi:hypothetical protein